MKLSKKIVFVFTCTLLFASCELVQVSDVDPPHKLVSENVVQDAESAEELLNGAYAVLHDQYYYMFSESTPGLLSGSMAAAGFLANGDIANNAIDADDNDIESYWGTFYKLIDASNTVLELVGERPESDFTNDQKQQILAEARFLRAMGHFDALRYFGQFYDFNSELGVIIRTSPVDFTTRDKERSSVEAVYNQILEDLDFAIQNGPALEDPYYASVTAAKALKAKVLLFKGDYAEAATLADEVITDGTRSLAPTFAEVFSNGFNSEEMIFMRHTNQVTYSSDRKQYTYGSGYAIAGDWLVSVLSGDPREAETYNPSNNFITKVHRADLYSPTYFIRLAEVYLIKAEALARSGASLEESKEPYEEVRSRALGTEYTSNATTKEELLDEIFNEIVAELSLENGSEWFAAIRFEKIMDVKPEVTDSNQFILPIPLSELQGNSSFNDQNPGYNQ